MSDFQTMAIETRGRDSARMVKIVSSLLLIIGIIGAIAAETGSFLGFISAGLVLLGFFGFVVGRFME